MMLRLIAAGAICASLPHAASAQAIRLIANLSTTPISSTPFPLLRFGDQLFFGATSAAYGRELFVTDGTAANTRLIADINPGPASALAYALPEGALALFDRLGPLLLFAADDGVHGTELWATDGTPFNTYLVADINPGPASSNPRGAYVNGNQMYFLADDGVHGYEPWVTDGTFGGTAFVLDVTPGSGSSRARIISADSAGYYLSSPIGATLYRKDFAAPNPVVLNTYGPDTGEYTIFNNTFFFAGTSTTSGVELWRSDSTLTGTAQVSDLNFGPSGSFPHTFTSYNGALFFSAVTSSNSLYRTDGSAAGTTPISGGWTTRAQNILGMFDNRLMLQVGDSLTGRKPSVWLTDTTAANTNSLTSVWLQRPPSPGPYEAYARSAITEDSTLYMLASLTSTTNPIGPQVFKHTPPGTTSTPATSATGPGPAYIDAFEVIHGRIIAAATDTFDDTELWASDSPGSLATSRIADLNPQDSSTSLAWLRADGNRLFFLAFASTASPQIGVTDGGPLAPILSPVVHPDIVSEDRTLGPAVLNSRLFFENRTSGASGTGLELWTCDGSLSPTGTHLVKDITPGGDTSIGSLTPAGSFMYFLVANAGGGGSALWRSDGTEGGAGTIPLTTSTTSTYANLTDFGGTLLCVGRATPGDPPAIWKSDGTAANTTRVRSFTSLSFGGTPITPVLGPANQKTAFFSSGPLASEGRELWKSDGTEAGTMLVRDIVPGPGSSNPAQLTSAGYSADGHPRLFFVATTPANGAELWFSDGTGGGAGTHLVKDIRPGALGSFISQLSAVPSIGGTPRAYFVADDGILGARLWISDGTESGTQPLPAINTFGGSDSIANLTIVRNKAFFTADNGTDGNELWTSNGTPGGTHKVMDLWPGRGSGLTVSDPLIPNLTPELTAAGNKLFFIANDGVHGQELFTHTLCLADFDNSGSVTLQDIFDFLAAYFSSPPDPAADINNDGAVSLQDIFDFLGAYFVGC